MSFSRPDEKTLQVRLAGDWTLGGDLSWTGWFADELRAFPAVERVTFDTAGPRSRDTGFLTFLVRLVGACFSGTSVDKQGLPVGVQRLLLLASAVPLAKGAKKEAANISFLERTGEFAVSFWRGLFEMAAFIGEAPSRDIAGAILYL